MTLAKKLTSTLKNLITLLNDGHYHDGTTLGQALNISRSAVWKAIKKLEAYGVHIDSIKGKGYALLQPIILLDKRLIKQGLENQKIDIDIFETIHSTNDYLKPFFNEKKIKICIAEQQTQGKGRLDRSWHSPFGQNIYLSCSYSFQKDVSELAGLSLIVSLAILKTLNTYHLSENPMIKWPNDILYEHKKISGNLIEVQAESYGRTYAVIGIGVNANMLIDKSHSIAKAWTSLRKIVNHDIDRNQFCTILINHLLTDIKRFEKQGLASFIDEWKISDYLLNKKISLKNGNAQLDGRARGINQLGHLILEFEDGTQHGFSSGDTTVSKILP